MSTHATALRSGSVASSAQTTQPQLLVQSGGQRHKNANAGCPQQVRDLLRLQHRVDGEHDACGFASPNREMGLGQVRQHKGDRMVGGHAQSMKGVSRLRHLGDQFGVGPDVPPVEVVCGQEEGQGFRAGRSLRAAKKRRIGVLGQRAVQSGVASMASISDWLRVGILEILRSNMSAGFTRGLAAGGSTRRRDCVSCAGYRCQGRPGFRGRS